MPVNTPPELVPNNYIKSIFVKQVSIKSESNLSIKKHKNQSSEEKYNKIGNKKMITRLYSIETPDLS